VDRLALSVLKKWEVLNFEFFVGNIINTGRFFGPLYLALGPNSKREICFFFFNQISQKSALSQPLIGLLVFVVKNNGIKTTR